MKQFKFWMLGLIALLVTGCTAPQNISYFQDSWNGTNHQIANELDIRMRPGDKLSIIVHSRDPQLTQMFNLPVATQRIGYTTLSNSSQQMAAYTIDDGGCIDFPTLGTVKVAGMTRAEIAATIKSRLIQSDLLKDPVVTVEFDNMYINVLGEVNRPGRYALTKEHITVLDALGMAGDLTIQGEREYVKVFRVEGEARKTYMLNLTRIQDVVNSPAYYLQQDDVVYVDPNDYRKRQTTVNGNNMRSTSFYISLASLLTSVAVLVFK